VSLDIVVVNYHTPHDLDAFLASLSRFPPTGPASLTVVEVAAGEEKTTPFEWAGGTGRWLAVTDNIGYGRACNLGAQAGGHRIIALFNADVEVTEHSLDFCTAALEARDDWGALGPCQVDLRNRIRHAGIFGSNCSPVHRGWSEIHRNQYCDVREAVTISGSAYFIKRKVWQELTGCDFYQDMAPGATGAFLPTSHYFEETFASYHSREHGHKVMYYGPVTMIHKWHQASPVGGWAEQQMPASREYFRKACAHHGIACD
jgi:GT2 family glycosyltransferase